MMTTGDAIIEEVQRIVNVVNNRFMNEVYPNLTEAQKGCMTGVHFLWGHPIEVVNTLKLMSKHEELKYDKFPCVCLFTDIDVYTGKYSDHDGTLLELIIANATDPNYTAPQRRNKNFLPIINEIYRLFMQELEASSVFPVQNPQTDMKHTAAARYYWGKKGLYGYTGNIFDDHVDAMHIHNLDLKVQPNYC